MAYLVYFNGMGWTEPTDINPKGIKVRAKGSMTVEGPRPKSGFDIPYEVIKKCKDAFMSETGCVRFAEDEENIEYFPTVKLGKEVRTT
jgi:hypothetical protein